jgi:phospholipid/cholesterol/gamma-HCH transport system substrate-binding protein
VRGNRRHRLPNTVVGAIVVFVIAIASVFAFTKQLPFSDGYEVQAVFTTAQNIRTASPVRIAGVNVGEVTDVRPLDSGDEELAAALGEDEAQAGAVKDSGGQQAAVVTMQIEDEARPIKQDATFQLRPRLFLEGNLFVDVKPGSPGSPEAPDGHTFPLEQSSVSVQLDQVLTTFQSDVREDLRTFLDEFGSALVDYGGAEGFQELYRSSAGSFKSTSQVNEALLGTEPHDLSGFIRNFDRVAIGLSRNEEQLKDLVTNFRVFAGSFAAQDAALERGIRTLPQVLEASRPAFRNLNAAFPPLRAFAREALPGVRSTGPTLDAATPWVHQVRLLSSKRELRGLTKDLRPTVPRLAKLSRRTLPFLDQARALSSCFNEVVIPWSNDSVSVSPDPLNTYPHDAVGTVAEETGYGLEGIAGESRSGDANGQYLRVAAGGAGNTVITSPPSGEAENFVGVVPFDLLGSVPDISDSAKTPFRPDRQCERQESPDLRSRLGPAPQQEAVKASNLSAVPGPVGELSRRVEDVLDPLGDTAAAKVLQGDLGGAGGERWVRFLRHDFPDLQRKIQALGGSG